MHLSELVRLSLQEDVGGGDVTTESTIPISHHSMAKITAKQAVVVYGHDVAREVFTQMECTYTPQVEEGILVSKGTVVATIEGPTGKMGTKILHRTRVRMFQMEPLRPI